LQWYDGQLQQPGVPEQNPVRIAVVLSAGGLRGAAHVGVLRELLRHRVPIDRIVGVSAGAVIAAYYAAVGLDLDELFADAERFRGRHLLAYSVNVHLKYRFDARVRRWCGVIPGRLRQLESATFDRLHHGVHRLGIVCHDLTSRQPVYFSTDQSHGVSLHEAVRASASIPHLFPAIPIVHGSGNASWRLTDGGVSDPVPTTFARSTSMGATHVIVSDTRWIGSVPPTDSTTVWIRPRLATTGTLWSPRRGLMAAVRGGEAAVTAEVLHRVFGWVERPGATLAASDRAGAHHENRTEP
jgi:NTE family protein